MFCFPLYLLTYSNIFIASANRNRKKVRDVFIVININGNQEN